MSAFDEIEKQFLTEFDYRREGSALDKGVRACVCVGVCVWDTEAERGLKPKHSCYLDLKMDVSLAELFG